MTTAQLEEWLGLAFASASPADQIAAITSIEFSGMQPGQVPELHFVVRLAKAEESES